MGSASMAAAFTSSSVTRSQCGLFKTCNQCYSRNLDSIRMACITDMSEAVFWQEAEASGLMYRCYALSVLFLCGGATSHQDLQ